MSRAPLLSAQGLSALMADASTASLLVVDCSFELTDAAAGRRMHDAAHLPGAVYAHLDEVMSAPKTGRNGRHPLPERSAFAARMAGLGASDDLLIVAYDNASGMYAARLWWMLRWVGHADVAVLDGGLAAWQAAGLPVTADATPARASGAFTVRPSRVATVGYDDVLSNIAGQSRLVVDARAADRFRGENETLDAVGGHIPGAVNRLFRNNLAADGRFKAPAELRAEFEALIGARPAAQVIHQCGSGVTACHNLLAMEAAGLSGAALYPGSWSEWCTQPGAPIATGTG